MKRRKDGPTTRILELARSAPGGVIRWHEAEQCYLDGSESARREQRASRNIMNRLGKLGRERVYASANYRMGVKRVLERHFLKVEGTRGYYVLKEAVNALGGEDQVPEVSATYHVVTAPLRLSEVTV